MTNPVLSSHGDHHPDLLGRQIGDFRLLRRLGKGAMATVYLAEQVSLHRNVALKILKPNLASDETYVRRFQREAQAAAAMVHGNIVQIYEVGHSDGIHFIAQEYVAGQNLAEMLRRSGPPPLPVAISIIRQVCVALSKAAEQGIVHRDIKPENLMLAGSGEVKVADFGLARLAESPEQMRLTQVGVTMGSPLYMSPEQAAGKPLDPRSDIYSFGVTCYHLLSGQPPFTGESPLHVAMQHLNDQPKPLRTVRPDLPAELCHIVHTMLKKKPDDRYATGADVLRELRQVNLDGFEADWPEDWEKFNLSETIALAATRSAATMKLDAVMQQSSRPKPLVRQRLFWAGLVSAFLFGVLIGWPQSEPSLLEDAAETTGTIQLLRTAEQQYRYAMRLDTEESWRIVIEQFPDDERFVRLARKQLANHYLTNDRFGEALRLFEDFERLGESEPEYMAYGLAGQYVVLALQRTEPERAAAKFAQWWPLREKLQEFDARLARQVYELARRNQQLLDRDKDEEIDRWLQRHLEESPESLDNDA
jgi:serine/threonine-protein kinase